MGGQDIHWDEAAVVAGKKFANKVWNIARYVLQRKFPEKPLLKKITDSENAKIIALLRKTQKSVEKDLNAYQFGPALHSAYDFIWHEFADVFIETSKSQNDEETDAVLYFTLKKILVLLHPFLPHLTEEIYQNLPDTKNLLMIEEW